MFNLAPLTGMKVQAVGGINWSHKYNDNDLFTIGGEYFYNQPGYSDTSLYPGLLLNSSYQQQFNFFYTGRQYAALFASFPQPYSWNLSTFTLSTLTNITDQSYVSRLDYSYILLTHMTLEAFAAVHYGKTHGEFRFGVDLLDRHIAPALIDLGLALRVKI
jgi:outer membrane protease